MQFCSTYPDLFIYLFKYTQYNVTTIKEKTENIKNLAIKNIIWKSTNIWWCILQLGLRMGRQGRYGSFHLQMGVQVKLWYSLTVSALPEHLKRRMEALYKSTTFTLFYVCAYLCQVLSGLLRLQPLSCYRTHRLQSGGWPFPLSVWAVFAWRSSRSSTGESAVVGGPAAGRRWTRTSTAPDTRSASTGWDRVSGDGLSIHALIHLDFNSFI